MTVNLKNSRISLFREVGESNMDLVLVGGPQAGWSGRSEQIDQLQQTVDYLQVRLGKQNCRK